jgi:ATP-dependent DNA helicase RecG
MIVEDADRFGLAQLHQLRGRVGRGEHPGYFLLFAEAKTDEGRARIRAISATSDGFELAEQDLELRGEGDILGSRQSGLPALRLLSLIEDLDVIANARSAARELIESDPHLERDDNRPLALVVQQGFGSLSDKAESG